MLFFIFYLYHLKELYEVYYLYRLYIFIYVYVFIVILFCTRLYNKLIFVGIISKLNIIQGTNIINAITIGNNIVQQNVINWSNLIRGNDALTHINVNIIKLALNPKLKPQNKPSIRGYEVISSSTALIPKVSVTKYKKGI